MNDRPGAKLASRPLHFIWIADCSESMILDGKIEALNRAIREAVPALSAAADANPHAEVLVRCLSFSTGVRWSVVRPTRPADLQWVDLQASGYTDLGAAFEELARALQVPPMESRALPPALVLVSDGRPTDDWRQGLDRVFAEPWGRKAVRLAVAIGEDTDLDVLRAFIDDPGIEPMRAGNAPELVHLLRWVSTAAARMASSPMGAGERGGDLTPPPMGRPREWSPGVTW